MAERHARMAKEAQKLPVAKVMPLLLTVFGPHPLFYDTVYSPKFEANLSVVYLLQTTVLTDQPMRWSWSHFVIRKEVAKKETVGHSAKTGGGRCSRYAESR